jgi:hypothetical protein
VLLIIREDSPPRRREKTQSVAEKKINRDNRMKRIRKYLKIPFISFILVNSPRSSAETLRLGGEKAF